MTSRRGRRSARFVAGLACLAAGLFLLAAGAGLLTPAECRSTTAGLLPATWPEAPPAAEPQDVEALTLFAEAFASPEAVAAGDMEGLTSPLGVSGAILEGSGRRGYVLPPWLPPYALAPPSPPWPPGASLPDFDGHKGGRRVVARGYPAETEPPGREIPEPGGLLAWAAVAGTVALHAGMAKLARRALSS